MQYINLGSTGLKVSRVCLGCMTYGSKKWREWVLDEDDSRPLLRRAIDLGINFFDTADMYSVGVSEEIVGRALKDFGPGRDRVIIATKVYQPMGGDPNQRGLSRKHILHAAENSLRRLGTDYIDLYQIHRFDYDTPVAETLEALHDLVRAGKVLYIGASSMYAWQLMKMLSTSKSLGLSRFVSMQNHYNLVYREEEREMLPLCRSEGLGVIPWSPLARGFLAGGRKKDGYGETARARTDDLAHNYYYEDADFAVVDAVAAIANQRGVPNAQVALAWLLHKPGIAAPIVGASKLPQLEDAIRAVELKLDEAEIKALEAPYRPHAVLGHT